MGLFGDDFIEIDSYMYRVYLLHVNCLKYKIYINFNLALVNELMSCVLRSYFAHCNNRHNYPIVRNRNTVFYEIYDYENYD